MALFDFNITLPSDWLDWFRRKKVVLVIEDDANTAKLIRRGAESEGFSVVVAESGEEALGILTTNGKRFVLVLLDVRLPGQDGWELRRKLIDHWPDILVCMMSGDRHYLSEFPNGDATLVLEKTVSYHKVFRELKRMV